MSTANTAGTMTGRYNPPTAERKLEKQLASAKANMNSLSTIPSNWKVKKDPKLGTHYVLILGQSEEEHANHFVIHRLIGQDYQINKGNAWIMSLASDIAGFQAAAEFSGKPKVVKLLSDLKNKTAVKASVLKISDEGLEMYPNGINRQEALNQARELSDAHAKVKGGNHFGEWLLYLSPDLVKAEIEVQSCTRGNPAYMLAASGILIDYAVYQTSLIDGKRQQEVPYLYGVAEKDVQRTIYSALFGIMKPKEKMKEASGIFPHKVYTSYTAGDDVVRKGLEYLLQTHANSRKEYNIAKSKMDSAKLKDEKAEAISEFKSKERELEDITSSILLAEKKGDYPSITAKTHFEISLDPEKGPTEIRKSIAKSP
jgi:hypothetical protein